MNMAIDLFSNDEILAQLSGRLRAQRLAQELSQQELAHMAGLSHGAVRNLEEHGQVTLSTLVRILRALGLLPQLETLFLPPRASIAQMESAEAAKRRQRAPRKSKP
jgi:transcriptional regulator with XRE-family HTH domain